jgi:MOSC domain-containing protein YiiM
LAEVHRLFVAFVHRQPMREVESVAAIANRGFEGCIHGRPGSRRQVLLMEQETIEALGLRPGVVKENITTRGLRLAELREGQRLRVGGALLEATVPCHPCHLMDEIRPGLQEALRGRRGMLCRVVEAGLVKQGDAIEVLDYMQVAS